MKLKATFTRRILAMMYFPDCEPQNAVRRLTGEIKRCVELYDLLTAKATISTASRYSPSAR